VEDFGTSVQRRTFQSTIFGYCSWRRIVFLEEVLVGIGAANYNQNADDGYCDDAGYD